jgi:hypothetical protein
MEELFYLRQLFSFGTTDWLKVAMLLGLLAVLIYRPERVRRPAAMTCACWLFALSIVIPPVLNALVGIAVDTGMSTRYRSSAQSPELITLVIAVGPMLFGISVLLSLLSLVPARSKRPAGPAKHPLE